MAEFGPGKNPFSSAFVGALLRMLWICYRCGMEEACRSGDPGECEEAECRLRDVSRFGTIGCDMDWNEWQFKVLQWTREDICRQRVMDLLLTLRSPSHKLAFILQLAKMYYLRGVREWRECWDWLTMERIANMPNYPYLLKRSKSFRPSRRSERFEMLQNECFSLIDAQQEFKDEAGAYAVPPRVVRAFVERVWSAMQNPKWFDDYDVEDDCADGLNPTEGVSVSRALGAEAYTARGRGVKRIENKIKKQAYERERKKADRRVPRNDAHRGDAPADGAVLQPGAPKRKRGRPPKNV